MCSWILLLLLRYAWAQTSAPVYCPTGYQDGQNGFCYKTSAKSEHISRDQAVQKCNFDGGRLASITNAFTNNYLRNIASAPNNGNFWTGLVCQTADKTTCQFDGAPTPLNASSYTNFLPNFPQPSQGPLVIMDSNSGKWLTTGYNQLAYICEVPIGNPSLGCSEKYDQKFNNCYKFANANNSANTEAFCNQDGGHVVSIHSYQENNYTFALANTYTSETYLRIGLTSNPNNDLTWSDGSTYDYDNFGLENNKYGSCVALSLRYGTIAVQQWLSSTCDTNFPSICKKPTERRYSPFVPQSTSSRDCPWTTSLNGGGMIYSPNYPYAYSGDSSSKICSYVLTADRDVVTISFTELNLESSTYINLYNDVTATSLITSLDHYSRGLGVKYNSTGPVMLMKFTASYENYNYGKWAAFYY